MSLRNPVAERPLTALELADLAERRFRQKLAPTQPDLSADAIELLVDEWYARRPGAVNGDCDGTPRSNAA